MIKLNRSFVAVLIALSGIIVGYIVAERHEDMNRKYCGSVLLSRPDCILK